MRSSILGPLTASRGLLFRVRERIPETSYRGTILDPRYALKEGKEEEKKDRKVEVPLETSR